MWAVAVDGLYRVGFSAYATMARYNTIHVEPLD